MALEMKFVKITEIKRILCKEIKNELAKKASKTVVSLFGSQGRTNWLHIVDIFMNRQLHGVLKNFKWASFYTSEKYHVGSLPTSSNIGKAIDLFIKLNERLN